MESKTDKFIIHNLSGLNDLDVIGLVFTVIKQGKISGNNDKYCYLTAFDIDGEEYLVSAHTKLDKTGCTFKITKPPVRLTKRVNESG